MTIRLDDTCPSDDGYSELPLTKSHEKVLRTITKICQVTQLLKLYLLASAWGFKAHLSLFTKAVLVRIAEEVVTTNCSTINHIEKGN